MNDNLQTFFCTDRHDLERKLATSIARRLRTGRTTHRSIALALSGGETPANLYRRLAREDLPWHDVFVTLVDERCVSADHPDSNEAMVRRNLLIGDAREARFSGLIDRTDPSNLKPVASPWPDGTTEEILDVVVLGMGRDGHTASWIPDSPQLHQALEPPPGRSVVRIDSPSAEHPRVTLTRPAVLRSRLIILYITGKPKKAVLARALESGPVSELPIRAVLHQPEIPVEVYWAP